MELNPLIEVLAESVEDLPALVPVREVEIAPFRNPLGLTVPEFNH
jgi:hypothetical protein